MAVSLNLQNTIICVIVMHLFLTHYYLTALGLAYEINFKQFQTVQNCIESCIIFYTVSPYDISITGNTTYPHGSQLQLKCLSEGGPQLEYSWSSPNSSYTTINNLTISNVTTLDGGNYTCTVTNDAGSSSNTVTVYGELVHITHVSFYLTVLCVKVGMSE